MDANEELPTISIGDMDENADWILTPERHMEELARRAREDRGQKSQDP